jgi:hypothetical protein
MRASLGASSKAGPCAGTFHERKHRVFTSTRRLLAVPESGTNAVRPFLVVNDAIAARGMKFSPDPPAHN